MLPVNFRSSPNFIGNGNVLGVLLTGKTLTVLAEKNLQSGTTPYRIAVSGANNIWVGLADFLRDN